MRPLRLGNWNIWAFNGVWFKTIAVSSLLVMFWCLDWNVDDSNKWSNNWIVTELSSQEQRIDSLKGALTIAQLEKELNALKQELSQDTLDGSDMVPKNVGTAWNLESPNERIIRENMSVWNSTEMKDMSNIWMLKSWIFIYRKIMKDEGVEELTFWHMNIKIDWAKTYVTTAWLEINFDWLSCEWSSSFGSYRRDSDYISSKRKAAESSDEFTRKMWIDYSPIQELADFPDKVNDF